MISIYINNDVCITIEPVDKHEGKLLVNGQTLIWISLSETQQLKQELTQVLDKYRI